MTLKETSFVPPLTMSFLEIKFRYLNIYDTADDYCIKKKICMICFHFNLNKRSKLEIVMLIYNFNGTETIAEVILFAWCSSIVGFFSTESIHLKSI